MIVSGRNNVKEILKNFKKNNGIKKAILQNNFNENDILSLLKNRNIPIKYEEKAKMDALAKNNHQGVILETGDYNYCSIDDIILARPFPSLPIIKHDLGENRVS